MSIESIKLKEIDKDKKYFLSYPLDITTCEKLIKIFPFSNFIMIDKDNYIIFGFEFIEYFQNQMKENIEVIRADISEKEALISAYNYKEKYFGLNTFEKLIFIQKGLRLFSVSELYKRVNLDISITDSLKNFIPVLIEEEFKQHLISGSINLLSILQLCKWDKKNRIIMLDFLSKIPYSKSQQVKIIEMFEELLFKEKLDAGIILQKLNLNDIYKEEKPQKKIIEKLFSYRYPAYKRKAESWEKYIKNLMLPPNISLTHYPFFEKKDIELKISIKKEEDIDKIIQFLKNQKIGYNT